MSGEFNINDYLRAVSDIQVRRRTVFPFTTPVVYRSADGDRSVLNNALRRHLQPCATASDIVIRHVRHVVARSPMETVTGFPWSLDALGSVAARPYARRGRTSSYWQDAGWEKRDRFLIGHYQASGRRFPGSIELNDSVVEPADYYIYDPPAAVLRGPHGPCFRSEGRVSGRNKYWIHFSEPPANVDSGIIQIQRDLATAFHSR